MNRFINKNSTWSYYKYLEKYDTGFLRKYQSGQHFYLGRKGAWKNLVLKQSGDHIAMEEEHNFKYKTHLLFTFASYRVCWILTLYMGIYCSFLLGDPGKVFNQADWDHACNPSSDGDNVTRYESLYIQDKPQKY